MSQIAVFHLLVSVLNGFALCVLFWLSLNLIWTLDLNSGSYSFEILYNVLFLGGLTPSSFPSL